MKTSHFPVVVSFIAQPETVARATRQAFPASFHHHLGRARSFQRHSAWRAARRVPIHALSYLILSQEYVSSIRNMAFPCGLEAVSDFKDDPPLTSAGREKYALADERADRAARQEAPNG
jgi:hypothetical protein